MSEELLKARFTIYIASVPYTETSGGVRALFLLCHHLNQLGFRAFMENVAGSGPSHLNTPTARPPNGPDDDAVVVYYEGVPGNPWRARHVVRYLLNKPGVASNDRTVLYEPSDIILTFDKSHVPPGYQSFDLYMPLVDRRHYYPPEENSQRSGFVICSKSKPDKPLVLPTWCTPLTLALPHRPRTHEALGELYRSSRAMIAYGRTTAIYEALSCGCPVLAISSPIFNQESFQPRFGGAGITWDLSEEGLRGAAADVSRFAAVYKKIEEDFPRHLNETMLEILSIAASKSVTPKTA
jgi:O-antigen biosynthesis protein